MIASETSQAAAGSGFVPEATRTIRDLRVAITKVFRSIPGGVRNSYDVHRYLSLDTKLSWQIYKISSNEEQELALASYVPAPASMKRLMKAARERGIKPELVDELGVAYAGFEHLVETHAGNRTRFNSMAMGLCDMPESPFTDLAHRRAIFNGHSHFWGLQQAAYVVTLIIHPSKTTPGLFNYAQIRGKFGVCRLRPDVDVYLDTIKFANDKGGTDTAARATFEPEATEKYRAPIIPQFCTQPLPEMDTVHRPDGREVTKLVGQSVGRKSTVDFVFGNIWPDTSIGTWLGTNRRGFGNTSKVPYPTALYIIDVLVHRPTFSNLEEHFKVYGNASLEDEPSNIVRARPTLPFREQVTQLRTPADCAYIPEVPIYPELVNYCCNKLEYRMEDLDVYRLKVEYPLMDTMVAVWFHPQ